MQTYNVWCSYTTNLLGQVQANTLHGARSKAGRQYGHLSGGLLVTPVQP